MKHAVYIYIYIAVWMYSTKLVCNWRMMFHVLSLADLIVKL